MITPIVKVVGMDCDLRCGYCYYDCLQRANENIVMEHAMIAQLLEFLAERSRKKIVTIIWHGGEPLLPGVEYYKEIVSIETRIAQRTRCEFRNRIQTNGTHIDGAWAEFFLEYGFRVGFSIDGPRAIHDAYRTDAQGKGSFDKTMRGFKTCKEAGLRTGCLAVLTDVSVGRAKDIFDFFIGEEIHGFRVKPCYEIDAQTGGPTSFSITPEQYGQFLIELFDLWINLDDPRVQCGPLDDYLRGPLGKRQKQCMFRNSCHTYWGVWPNGDIHQCEFYGAEETFFGNCMQTPFENILRVQQESDLNRKMKEVRTNCKRCKWLESCSGGCARYDIGLGKETNLFCISNKMVLAHIENYLRE